MGIYPASCVTLSKVFAQLMETSGKYVIVSALRLLTLAKAKLACLATVGKVSEGEKKNYTSHFRCFNKLNTCGGYCCGPLEMNASPESVSMASSSKQSNFVTPKWQRRGEHGCQPQASWSCSDILSGAARGEEPQLPERVWVTPLQGPGEAYLFTNFLRAVFL